MSTAEQGQFDAIVAQVATWPQERRMALLRRLMESQPALSTRPSNSGPFPRGVPVEEMRGLIKVPGKPPTDEEVRKILEDAILEKYG